MAVHHVGTTDQGTVILQHTQANFGVKSEYTDTIHFFISRKRPVMAPGYYAEAMSTLRKLFAHLLYMFFHPPETRKKCRAEHQDFHYIINLL